MIATALRAHSNRLWTSEPRSLYAVSRAPFTTTPAAATESASDNSSSGSSHGKGEAQSMKAATRVPVQGDAADSIARAAAVLDERALRGGFVPSPDAHLETASQFGGPGASAVRNMVEAVYGMFAGDRKAVQKSVEDLAHGSAGVPRRPLSTRWARTRASSAQQDEEDAAAIRETLAAYRYAGMVPGAVTAQAEAAAEKPAAAGAAGTRATAAGVKSKHSAT